jgi:putative chitinase
MRIDHAKFFNGYRSAFGRMSQGAVNGIEQLGLHMESDPDLTDLRWAAYMLATVKHECANTWRPICERGQRAYFDKYEHHTMKGRVLGNKHPGDGWRYRGRGYVQITGRGQYETITKVLGLSEIENLIEDPDQALRPLVAYRIMSHGMRHGIFTQKKLSDYINDEGCDYKNARRIINGTDKCELIASYAVTLEKILRGAVE